MTSEADLESLVERGLFVDNLYELCRLCMQRARSTTEPVAYYVLAKMFNDIASDWDGRPVSNDEAEHLEIALTDHMQTLLGLMRAGTDSRMLTPSLNQLLTTFLNERPTA